MADAERRARRLKWALVVSLGLNLAVAGIVGGALLKGPPTPPWPGMGLWHYARALPDHYRRDLGQALRATRRDWIGPREALREQRSALAGALTAEPYRPDAVSDVLMREARLMGELSSRGADLILAQIARMTPDERRAYAQALMEKPKDRRD